MSAPDTGRRGRAVGLLGAVLLLASVPAASSAQEAPEDFIGYEAVATGTALTAFPSVPALLPVEVPAEATVALATATLSSGGQGFGRASTVFPGTLITGVRALIETAAGARLPIPDYPLVVESREFEDAKRNEQPGITMGTDVDPDRSAAVADAGGLGLPGIIGVRAMRTESVAELEPGRVTATSTTTVSGIDILGAVSIGSVVSTSSVTSDGTTSTCSGGVTVSGVTVGGTRAILDEGGLRLDDAALVPGLGLGGLVDQVVRSTGIDVRVLDGIDSCATGFGSRSTAGVLVNIPLPAVAAIPAGGGLQVAIGSTSATAGGSMLPAVDLPLPEPAPPTVGDVLPFLPGAGTTGSFAPPVALPPAVAPNPAVDLGPDPEDVAYAFGGVPAMALLGLALLAVPASARVRRYMDRILGLVAT